MAAPFSGPGLLFHSWADHGYPVIFNNGVSESKQKAHHHTFTANSMGKWLFNAAGLKGHLQQGLVMPHIYYLFI